MKRRATLVPILIAVGGLWIGAACRETTDPEMPNPGPVTVAMTSPNANDGGVRFTVSGGTVDSVTAGAHDIFHATVDGGTERVIVIGALAPGGIAQIWVPDRNQLDGYVLTLEEVAARNTYANRPLTGYTLTIVMP